MAGISVPARMKRKDLEDVSGEFLLSAPATKMRRLQDAYLPPIMEEQDPAFPPILLSEQRASVPAGTSPLNGERALVLYKPVSDPALQPSPSYTLSSELLLYAGLKNEALWWRQHGGNASRVVDLVGNLQTGHCLAVIPWQGPEASGEAGPGGTGELMDAAEVEPMEVEEEARSGHWSGRTA